MKLIKRIGGIVLCFLAFQATWAQEEAQVLFKAGEDGYGSYRIPAIIRAANGDILAFAEGRVDGAADFGNIQIIMKRSTDGGQTWSDYQIVASNDTLQAGNPAPVVDNYDPEYPDGRIFMFYNTGNASEGEVRRGRGERKVWYVASEDQGQTWSDPVEITNQTKKKNWRAYANTPGHALQFQEGQYKGRIYIAANHSQGDPCDDFSDYKAHGFYTDDHGKTFHISETVWTPGGNENTATPLPGGKLMMNIRNQRGGRNGAPKTRIIALSNDGGETWDKVFYDHNLPDPVNQGSILNLGEKGEDSQKIAFSNAADPDNRINLTLRISNDGGKTWSENMLVDKKGESTAYSDIVKLGDHKIGILYERKGYQEIAFKIMEW